MIRSIGVLVFAFLLGSISTRLFYAKQIRRLKIAHNAAFHNGWLSGIKEGNRLRIVGGDTSISSN